MNLSFLCNASHSRHSFNPPPMGARPSCRTICSRLPSEIVKFVFSPSELSRADYWHSLTLLRVRQFLAEPCQTTCRSDHPKDIHFFCPFPFFVSFSGDGVFLFFRFKIPSLLVMNNGRSLSKEHPLWPLACALTRCPLPVPLLLRDSSHVQSHCRISSAPQPPKTPPTPPHRNNTPKTLEGRFTVHFYGFPLG